MTLKDKIYAALIAAAILAAGISGGWVWSNYKIGKFEKAVDAAKQDAEGIRQHADKLEQKASEYREKTEYLEGKLTEIQAIARKQDEELEKTIRQTNDLRDDARRARVVRSIQSTSAELCAKLAEIGHGCE